MGDTYLVRKLEKLEASLGRLSLPAGSPVLVDRIDQLKHVLERMRHTTAGEVRIVALGANSSMKSTTLRLLLGRDDIFSVGPGAVSAVSTELRLVQDEGPTGPPEYTVVTLSEEGARRRARRLLDLEEDDPRSLEELSRAAHPHVGLVQEMLEAVDRLGYGETLTMEQLAARGGSVIFTSGRGTPLIARVNARLHVPAEVWPLDWAAGRSVVIVDTPGTRKGGALEDVVIAETQSRAHIALLTVACGGGTQFTTPRTAPDPHCVFVATRIDAVDNPSNANSLDVLETSVASLVRDIGADGRPILGQARWRNLWLNTGHGPLGALYRVWGACRDELPMICIGGAGPRSLSDMGSLQDMDSVRLMTPVSKWAVQIPETRRIKEYIDSAFRIAQAGLPAVERVDDAVVHQQQDPAVATGAGHHSVLRVPASGGEPEAWYVVYHRRPLGKKGANERVTCIDRMEFDEKGMIKPVKMTVEGVGARPLE